MSVEKLAKSLKKVNKTSLNLTCIQLLQISPKILHKMAAWPFKQSVFPIGKKKQKNSFSKCQATISFMMFVMIIILQIVGEQPIHFHFLFELNFFSYFKLSLLHTFD
jgi:hypothetical protein